MKKVFSLLCVTIAFSVNAQVNLSNGLTACYALNGNAAEPINNLTGLISSVTSTVNRFNAANTAMYFNGTSTSYIELQDTPFLKPANALSFSCWINTPSMDDMYILFTKNSQFSYFEAYELCIDPSLHFMARKAGSSSMDMVVSTTSLTANTWFHLVVSLDNSNVSLYVNGVLEATTPASTVGFDYTIGKKVYLGATNEISYDAPFIGTMDNIRFYDRTLSAAEVSALYTQDPECVTVPAPTASFTASSKSICKGQNVTYTNQSAGGTSNLWTFAGGSPATSTIANPVVSYSVPGVYSITLTVSNASGSTSSVKQVTVNACTGISEHANALDVVLYPNPCNGILFIRGQIDQETTVELSDLSGKVVLRKLLSDENYSEIDLQSLSAGIYFVKVQSQGQFTATKLIKEN